MAQVIRASTPPRGTDVDEHYETLWSVARAGAAAAQIRAELVGLTDGVELQLSVGGVPRPRLRFLRDTGARAFASRMHAKLLSRGFLDDGRRGAA